ncbi:MAG: hypothetical protein QF371_05855 [Flavobacteriales bacterium]|nr:hypothetical protein [Flavobacteriales bacterium]
MPKTIKDIVEKLPEGFSDSGMEEISEILESVVESRVNEATQELTARVSGFLRLRLDEMKEAARTELEAEDSTYKAVKIYEAIKSIVAEDLDDKDKESVIAKYKEENHSLRESLESVNDDMARVSNENSILEDAVSKLKQDYEVLSEVEKVPFKSSEQALIITNEESNQNRLPQEAVDNTFLTEEVIKLANNNTHRF